MLLQAHFFESAHTLCWSSLFTAIEPAKAQLLEYRSASETATQKTSLSHIVQQPIQAGTVASIHFDIGASLMNTIPTIVTSTAAGFQPAFKPVTTQDRHACALAAVATIASVPIDDVWRKAEELGLPKTGPYNHVIDGDFLAALLAKYGWVAQVWKACEKVSQLPAAAIALVDYDETWEVGRHVVFHRAKASHDAKVVEYVVDPTATKPELQIRTDLGALAPAWYIGVHPMGKAPATSAKK